MINYVSLTSDVAVPGGLQQVEERWYLNTGLYQKYVASRLTEERAFDANDNTWRAAIQALDNMDSGDILAKLRNAVNTNKAYLDKVNGGTATNTDHLNQVQALTRQMTAVLLRTVLETH